MKRIGVVSAAALFLLFGSSAYAYAPQEQHEEEAKPAQAAPKAAPAKQEEAKPAKQEEAKPAKQQEAKPEKEQQAKAAKPEEAKPAKQQEAKPAKQEEKPQAEKPEESAKTTKQEPAKNAKQEENNKPAKQEAKAQGGEHQPVRTAAAEKRQSAEPALRLSARGSSRIPDARFQSNFGSGHTFRISSPRIVDGYSRFQYGGYWFGFVQPWPAGWYYTDSVYVDYIDGGYYLYNPYYPGARVSISVVL